MPKEVQQVFFITKDIQSGVEELFKVDRDKIISIAPHFNGTLLYYESTILYNKSESFIF